MDVRITTRLGDPSGAVLAQASQRTRKLGRYALRELGRQLRRERSKHVDHQGAPPAMPTVD